MPPTIAETTASAAKLVVVDVEVRVHEVYVHNAPCTCASESGGHEPACMRGQQMARDRACPPPADALVDALRAAVGRVSTPGAVVELAEVLRAEFGKR